MARQRESAVWETFGLAHDTPALRQYRGVTRRSAWCSALLLVAFACASPVAPGFAQTMTVSWSAPSSCPSQSELLRRIASVIEPARWPSDLRASASVTENGLRFRLELAIDVAGRRAQRSVTARTCEAVAETAAWLIAVSMDPAAALGSRETSTQTGRSGSAPSGESGPELLGPSPEIASATAGDPASTSDAQTTERIEIQGRSDSSAPRPRERHLWLRTGVLSGLWAASLPGPQVSLGARAGLGIGLFYVELRAMHVFARARRTALGELDVDGQEMAVASCVQWGRRLRAGPCLNVSALRSHARMKSSGDDQAIFWAVAGASANLGWLVYAPFELYAEAGLGLPMSARPRFRVRAVGELERAGFLDGYAHLGVNIRLE